MHDLPSDLPPLVVRPLVALLRALMTDSAEVGPVARGIRQLIMVPVFGLYLIYARWRLIRGKPMTVLASNRDGRPIVCRPPDLVTMYIHLFGCWEPDISAFIERRLHPEYLFLDVGAFVGYYTLLAAEAVGPNGGVLAVEASPRIFDRLQENLALNSDFTNVRAVNVAAAAGVGTRQVYEAPEHNLGRTTTSPRSEYEAVVDVQALPLSEVLTPTELENLRLIKIDVEGGEDQVLAGMVALLSRCPPDMEILVEMTPDWWLEPQTIQQVLQPFFSAGFHAYELENNYWPWRYLWPRQVRAPRRIRYDLDRRIRRLDIVLSRVDAETL